MTKQNVIELVNVSPASIFTREDVVKLINRIDDVPAVDETVDVVEETADTVVEETADTVVEEVLEDEADVISFERQEFIRVMRGIVEDRLNDINLKRYADVQLSMDYDNHVSVEDITYEFDETTEDIMNDVERWINDNTKTEKA
jgi:hypothetical protein